MRRDGQHPPDGAQAPFQLPRPCDHCATLLPEDELLPSLQEARRDVYAELLCRPCWQRATRRGAMHAAHQEISERCLMDHHLEKTVNYDVGPCIACGGPLLRGAEMFECTICHDMWTYGVDCKNACRLRPSPVQRQHNAQTRARGKLAYVFAPASQPSDRRLPAVEEEEKDVVTALTSTDVVSMVEELATQFVDTAGFSRPHAMALRQVQQGNLESALRAHVATVDGEERLEKELHELFSDSGAASSSGRRSALAASTSDSSSSWRRSAPHA